MKEAKKNHGFTEFFSKSWQFSSEIYQRIRIHSIKIKKFKGSLVDQI